MLIVPDEEAARIMLAMTLSLLGRVNSRVPSGAA